MALLSRLNFKTLRASGAGQVPRHAHTAGWLALVLLTLTGSLSVGQRAAADTSERIAKLTGGRYSPKGLAALTARMTPYAARLAALNIPGAGEWTPRRTSGWSVYDIENPPELIRSELSFEDARLFNALVPASPLPNPAMTPFSLKAGGAERERALLCLTQAVYYEAGFEAGEGQRAVAQVVLNRLRHPGYPKSVCGVVYQGSQRQTGCQFSFTCDGSLQRPISAPAWDNARAVARAALGGHVHKPVGASTHYHADYVFPYWAVTLVKLNQIGTHIFYRMTGPNGAPAAFSGRYAGGELSLPASVLTGGDSRTPDAPSVITPALPPAPVTRTVMLTVGDEQRSYTVVDRAAGDTPPSVPGAIQPTRRAPTPEEIRLINEKLKAFEAEQKAQATPP